MKKEIKISEENALNAYKNASPEGKELQEHLLGKDLFKPKDIMERIKTFDDALQELNTKALSGDETAAILLADYESNADNIKNPQILAYMRLAIIAYALNEGWEPKFTTDEYRYYPWFCLYTQKEIDEMDEEDKGRVLGRSATLRTRTRVSLIRTRITPPRTRTRTTVVGSASRQEIWLSTQASSSSTSGLSL